MPSPRRPGSKSGREWLLRADWRLVGGIALLGVAVLLALGLFVAPRVWLAAGVRSLGVDLGGKTRTQAVKGLQEDWQARTVLLTDGEFAQSVDLTALGLALDAERTVQGAFERGMALDQLGARLRGDAGMEVIPLIEFEPATAKRSLRALRSDIDVSPVNASLRRVDGRVEASDPRPGRSLDVLGTVARLEEDPRAVVEAGRLDLIVRSVPPLAFDASSAVAQANEWLARTFALSAYDPIADEAFTWEIASEQWGAWVSMNVDALDPTRVEWNLNEQAAAATLAAWEASLGDGRFVDNEKALAAVEGMIMGHASSERLRVYHSPGQHTVRPGETLSSIARDVGIPYPWIEQANPGVSDSLRVGQVLSIPSPDVLLPLPVVEHKRIVISLSRQRMWAYENGALRWEWPVSTGIPSSPTAPGVFQIQSHDLNAYASSWDLWMPYFMGIYRPVPTSSFMNGFHGFPTRDGATLLWTGDLGRPVTFGCVLLGNSSAPALYQWAEEGVIVEIRK